MFREKPSIHEVLGPRLNLQRVVTFVAQSELLSTLRALFVVSIELCRALLSAVGLIDV